MKSKVTLQKNGVTSKEEIFLENAKLLKEKEYVEDILKNVMYKQESRTLYEIMDEFFYHLRVTAPKGHNYIIALTRRAYLLYKIFERIYDQSEHENEVTNSASTQQDKQDKVILCNTHSLAMLDFEHDDRVLVFDDIIVQGSSMLAAVNDVKDKFKKKCEKEPEIDIWCLFCNSQAAFLEEINKLTNSEGKSILKIVRYVNPIEWKEFSDKMTEVVATSSIGYASYVKTFEISKEIYSHYHDLVNEDEIKKDKFGNEFFVLWDCGNDLTGLRDQYNIFPCIRFYKKEKIGSYLAIPYVFLPSLHQDKVEKYCKALLNKFKISLPTLPEKSSDSDKYKKKVFIYKWTVAAVSQMVLRICLNVDQLKKCQESLDCQESFGGVIKNDKKGEITKQNASYSLPEFKKEHYNYTDNNVDRDIHECIAHDCKDTNIKMGQKIFGEAVESSGRIVENFEDIYNDYTTKINKENTTKTKEAAVSSTEPPMYRIRIEDMFEKMGISQNTQNIQDIQKILEVIIASWDVGSNTYNIVSTEDGIIAGVIRHGEQSYRTHYERFSDEYPFFYEYFCQTDRFRIKDIQKFAEDFQQYFQRHFRNKTVRFMDFVKNLNEEEYFSDLLAIGELDCSSGYGEPARHVENYVMSKGKII